MAGTIDNVKAHFAALDIRKLSVEEWGSDGEPLVIYAKPLTLEISNKLQKLARNNDMELMALVIIHCSLDGEGNRIFDLTDKVTLMKKADVKVINRVATWLFESEETVEDTAKK